MADLNYWFAPIEGRATTMDAIPAMSLGGQAVIATVADCSTSKQTAVAPDLGTPHTVGQIIAIGGPLWVVVGADPTAVAAAAGALYVANGDRIPVAILPGERLAAINAT